MDKKLILSKKTILFLKVALFISIFILAFWLSKDSQDHPFVSNLVSRFNYLAVFVIGVIGGLNLAVPIPGVVFMPLFLDEGLNFWAVILTITAGMLLADSFAFLLGKTGRHILFSFKNQNRFFQRMEKLRGKNKKLPYLFLFIFATLAPFPNEVLVVPMGLMGYKIKNMIIPLVAGNFLFNLFYALGVVSIFDIVF